MQLSWGVVLLAAIVSGKRSKRVENVIAKLTLNSTEYHLGQTIEVTQNEAELQITVDVTEGTGMMIVTTQRDAHLFAKIDRLKVKQGDSVQVNFVSYCPDHFSGLEHRRASIQFDKRKFDLKVKRVCPEPEEPSVVACTVAIVLSCVSIITAFVAVFIYLCVQRRNKTPKEPNSTEDEECLITNDDGIPTIPRRSVRLLKTLQEGKLGVIYHAEIIKGHKPCLIKALSRHLDEKHSDSAQTNDRLVHAKLEASMLYDSKQLLGLRHNNICSLLYQVTDGDEAMAVFPWIEVGNLKLFLRRCQLRTPTSRPSAKSSVSTFDLISIAQQAAEALSYLESQRVIHGDIATRNSQLGANNRYYLCDSALSMDLFPADYEDLQYDGHDYKVPVRWSPPERLDIPTQISLKGDIWSFGIFLWELLSLAREPYSDIEPYRIVDYLQNGYRAIKPLGCPSELYELMTNCWQYQAEQRPGTDELYRRLDSIKQHQII